MWPANRASASISPASAPEYSATRRISELNSIAFRKRDQPLVIGLVDGEVADRHVELDLIVERDELFRQPRFFRVVDQRLRGAFPV